MSSFTLNDRIKQCENEISILETLLDGSLFDIDDIQERIDYEARKLRCLQEMKAEREKAEK